MSVATAEDLSAVGLSTVDQPPRARRVRSLIGWLLVTALVIGGAALMLRVAVSTPSWRETLDPEGVGETGAMALAEILRDQGVEVHVYRSRLETAAALDADTTLVMANPVSLSDEGVAALIEPADRVVFLSTGTHLVELLELGENAVAPSAPVEAHCDAPEFALVGTIRPDRFFAPGDRVRGCFGDDGAFAVLTAERDGAVHTVVEGARLFSNARLAEDGNAALALALLGQTDKVAWYVPSFADSDFEEESPETLGSLTPDWLTPAIMLLLLTGIAAALWRGRRFGPLVAETLPVTVRASETMHGRARLTAKAADAAHAAAALQEGSRRRLAKRLGLALTASADEIADAAADRLRIPRGSLQDLLGGPVPSHDAALVLFARQLAELETSVDSSHALLENPSEEHRDR
ncbi:DUF4350 domain-containing protein [Microbacterium sp.]|uniref:DUF4350 domain-containing protein n=1 Tax=Microbacterium sp. TaxID=51671 RepID=UPI0039E705BA